jgi:hypothetical protein
MRKVTLSKGAALWEVGDAARTIAVLERGTLGIKTASGLVGVASPRTVLGETAIFSVSGAEPKRTAALVALEDDTAVSEYPASMVKEAIDTGKDEVGPLVLATLIGQSCRNLLILISAHRNRVIVEAPLKTLMQTLIEKGRALPPMSDWNEFMIAFRFLYELREHTESLRESLTGKAQRAEASVKASEVVRDLFKGEDVASYLEALLKEERERDRWLERGGAATVTPPSR